MSEFIAPIITELLPKPTTGSEWVELYNPTNTSVSLTGWTLYDQLSQPSLIYTFAEFNLAAHTTVVVEVNKKLNDGGDGVTLKNPAGITIDTISYTSTAPADQSYTRQSLQDQQFDWQDPTPHFPPIASISPSPSPLPTASSTPKPSPTIKPTAATIPTANPTITTALQTNLFQAITITPTPTTGIWPTPILLTYSTANDTDTDQLQPTISPSPNLPNTRQVYFPDHRSPDAALSVILGGLILTTYNGFLIWFDWQQSLTAEL